MMRWVVAIIWLASSASVLAQVPSPNRIDHQHAVGTVVLLRAEAELFADNDEARLSIFVQEQNAEASVAASVVNRKMAEAIARVKKEDPSAEVRSTGYFTNPVYANNANRVTSWQARQDVQVITRHLPGLERLVAAVQGAANLSGVQFGVSRDAQRKFEAKLFELAFKDFQARIANVARALGKSEQDVDIEEINLSSVDRPIVSRPISVSAMARTAVVDEVTPPRFEPGDSRQTLSFTARVRVKQ